MTASITSLLLSVVTGAALQTLAVERPAASASSIRLVIDLGKRQPLSEGLYGCNAEMIYNPVWFDQPAFAEKYEAIGRPFFRFPGGTPSNFYNPQTGLFDVDSQSDREYSTQNEKILKLSNGAGRKPEAFFKFAREHTVRYSLVLNVCTQTYEQNEAWLEQIASAGNRIPAIEIGNEVFFGNYKWAFPKPTDYLERAKKLTTLIRKLFPETKVGVVLPPRSIRTKGFSPRIVPPA